MTSRQQAHWVLRAQCGDRDAIERLLASVQPPLTRYVRAIVGARDAEDVAQEVMVTIYRRLDSLLHPDLLKPWMYRIASRTAFRHLQKARRWPDYLRDDEALGDIAAPEIQRLERDVDQLLQDERVTPASRAVLALHFKEGLTLPEVAAVLDIPLGTAKSRMAYGLSTLRRHYADGGTGD
ncbi:MAG TPA: sigma-70 family RNA polymerase sigma factor [Vicinamibacterales bacterium]|nr:sigma-70 family RNA polymerase sigma factor [Vicinamibacterales bacterium]